MSFLEAILTFIQRLFQSRIHSLPAATPFDVTSQYVVMPDQLAEFRHRFGHLEPATDPQSLPHEDFMGVLEAVCRDTQHSIRYQADERDEYSLLLTGGKGDCDEYAVTSCHKLLALGLPARIVWCLVDGQGHMVCECSGYILCNLQRGVMRRDDLDEYKWLALADLYEGPVREIAN